MMAFLQQRHHHHDGAAEEIFFGSCKKGHSKVAGAAGVSASTASGST